MPNQSRSAQTAARMVAEFSPMPPVKTMASAPLRSKQISAEVMPHGGHEDVNRLLTICDSCRRFDVAQVIAAAAETQQAGAVGQVIEDLLQASCPWLA